ncbi:MAG TPA: class I SAM-dependent methyltransferase [Cyclobacteriaceae bacterium]|nr:class I SAM-dependent methyltransferase [Cyclobacteriaceae bacterium]
MRKINAFLKSFILFLRPGIWLNFLAGPLQLLANTIRLSRWTTTHGKAVAFNDFYRPSRNYSLRYNLYDHVLKQEALEQAPVTYLEFGVAKGLSFQWWIQHNKNADSRFYGFDTFEGLPEKWGTFSKGSMSFGVPELNDDRHEFYKGLFQLTLFNFIDSGKLKPEQRKIIHLDADLFSSTLFVLTTLHRYLKKGDILFFDEFNVPNHEFLAFDHYVKSFYVDYEVIGAVNNYFQIAVKLK